MGDGAETAMLRIEIRILRRSERGSQGSESKVWPPLKLCLSGILGRRGV